MKLHRREFLDISLQAAGIALIAPGLLNVQACSEINSQFSFILSLERLLTDNNIKGFCTEEYHLTRWRVYGGDLELFIGAALSRCGSKTGYDLLVRYLNDVHYNFKKFAVSELKALTDMDYEYNTES